MARQEDFDALLNFLLAFVEDMLAKHGEFFPFAAMTAADGEIAAVAVDLGEEHPASDRVIEALTDALRARALDGRVRACGICSDAIVARADLERTDAVCVTLEHEELEPVEVYLPYSKGPDGYAFGELFAIRGERRVFA